MIKTDISVLTLNSAINFTGSLFVDSITTTLTGMAKNGDIIDIYCYSYSYCCFFLLLLLVIAILLSFTTPLVTAITVYCLCSTVTNCQYFINDTC